MRSVRDDPGMHIFKMDMFRTMLDLLGQRCRKTSRAAMTTRKASLKERIVLAACKLNEKLINELTCISTGGGLVMLVSLFDNL